MISFTDTQIKDMTKDTLLLPFMINDPATGMIAQKNTFLETTGSLLTTDNNQKIYSDFYIEVCSKYHAELALLNNTSKTNYLDSNIVSAGKGVGDHFPVGSWVNFSPKIIDSVTGLPSSTLSNNLESYNSGRVAQIIDILKNGFSSGNFNHSGTVAGNTFTTTEPIGSIANGSKIAVYNGTSFFIATVDSFSTVVLAGPPASSTTALIFTKIYGTVFSGAATVISNFVGFTDSQRSGVTSAAPRVYMLTAIEAFIDLEVLSWNTYIQSIKTIVDANGDLPPRKASNVAAQTACANALSEILAWQGKPVSTVLGRFTDILILPIETLITTRNAFTPARVSDVISNLGSVAQASDGSYTPTGSYGELFRNIDLRVSRGTGTLTKYNDAQLCVTFFDKKIAAANDQLTQYNNTFAITKILADTVIGQIDFQVASVTDFTVGDSVKLMDNGGSVYSRSISLITGDVIRVNSGIPVVLSISGMARIVKMK